MEIRTPKQLAYALYTHQHDKPPKFGALLRVFDRTFSERPKDFEAVAVGAVRFSTFFPLAAAVSKGIVQIVGNVQVPDKLAQFPVFRSGTVDPATGKVASWSLWDGEHSRRVGNLTLDQRRLPIRAVWNDTLLIEKIDSCWTPEADPR